MNLKLLLFTLSFFAVFFIYSQNVKADCTYGTGAFPSGTLQDQQNIFNCIKVPDSYCNGICGAWTEGCDGTKVKVKVITQCYSVSFLTPCGMPVMLGGKGGDHIEVGLRYTYKDCATDPVNKKCYAGACVECLSDVDCVSPNKCNTATHKCYGPTPPVPSCPDGTFEGACCATPGTRCKKDASNNLVCQADSTCTTPCKSCPDGTALWECSSSGQRCNPVGGVCTLQNDASCVKATGCSAYNGDGKNCNSAGGCYYCAIYGTCLATTDTSCPGYVDCSSYASQSGCESQNGRCGWCPNSYNGGTSANNGICYSASTLAEKCDKS